MEFLRLLGALTLLSPVFGAILYLAALLKRPTFYKEMDPLTAVGSATAFVFVMAILGIVVIAAFNLLEYRWAMFKANAGKRWTKLKDRRPRELTRKHWIAIGLVSAYVYSAFIPPPFAPFPFRYKGLGPGLIEDRWTGKWWMIRADNWLYTELRR